jgi:hypothetical protein
VAVDSSSDLLVQFLTRLPGQDHDVTVTLSDHGPRQIEVPVAEQTVDAAAHPEITETIGL